MVSAKRLSGLKVFNDSFASIAALSWARFVFNSRRSLRKFMCRESGATCLAVRSACELILNAPRIPGGTSRIINDSRKCGPFVFLSAKSDHCWHATRRRCLRTLTSRICHPQVVAMSARIRSTGISIPPYAEVDTTIHVLALLAALNRKLVSACGSSTNSQKRHGAG
jgi:hypothetical protein